MARGKVVSDFRLGRQTDGQTDFGKFNQSVCQPFKIVFSLSMAW